jgi:hypothetical protein
MDFKNYVAESNLKESLQNTTGSQADSELINFILTGLHLANQTHVYYLLTKSLAEHLAIGDFYDGLRGNVDSLAEMLIGLEIEGMGSIDSTLVFLYSRNELLTRVNEFRKNVNVLLAVTNTDSMMSINDNLINIQQLIDSLKYKLQ